ncbi:MAG: sensor histidine kinase [Caldilineaceae bacterium]
MSEHRPAKTDRWDKGWWLWSLILTATLLFAAVEVWFDARYTAAQKGPMVILSVVFALWNGAFITYLRNYAADFNRERDRYLVPALIYLSGAIGLWFALAARYPDFNLVLASLPPQLFSYVRLRWAIPIGIVLTGMAVYLQAPTIAGLLPGFDSGWVGVFLIVSVAAILFAFYLNGIMTQSADRRELIEQLEATRAELAAAERREGILQERARLAREIHDTLAQGFISIITHLEASEQNLSDNVAQSRRHLTQAKEMARHGVSQARRVVQDLRPEVLEKSPLPEAIQRVVQDWTQQSGIGAQTTITGAHTPLHPEAETTLIRAVQEALANVQKHAQASSVQVTLSYMDNVLMLDVQDNGIGLDNAPPPSNGGDYGLTAMRQRVSQVGGSLTVESEPGEGTTVVVQVPIQPMARLQSAEAVP